jgi:hypothetical protein
MIPEREDSVVSQVRAAATPPACRRFALTLLGALPAAGLLWLLILRWTADRWIWSVPLGFVAAAVLLAGPALAAPAWARRLYVTWHAVTRAIELALTWVLLALVFWLVITPVGLIRRRRSTGFHVRPALGAKSCWQEVSPVKDPSRYYRQF